MAVLTQNQRQQIFQEIDGIVSNGRIEVSLTKEDIRSSIAAMDDWLELNMSGLNLAIPQPSRGILSIKMKMWLFEAILRKRREIS